MDAVLSLATDSEDDMTDMLADDVPEESDKENKATKVVLGSTPVASRHQKNIAFQVFTPETIGQKLHKRALSEASDIDNIPKNAPPPKKTKKSTTIGPKRVPNYTPALPVSFKTILRIEKNTPPVSAKQKGSAKLAFHELEPFEFSTNGSFPDYLDAVAATLPCPRHHLVTAGMQWKPEKPKNADPHPLTSAVGFKSIINKMLGAKANERMIILFVKPPLKPVVVDKHPWIDEADNANRDSVSSPARFDFSAVEVMEETSVERQKVKFDTAIRGTRERLEARYPIGNNPLFPEKRIYHDTKNGWYFDLTALRLASWANNMMKGAATEDSPPNNTHFDANSRIKTIPKVTPMPSRSTLDATGDGLHLPTPATSVGPSLTDIMQLLLVQQLQQQQQQLSYFQHQYQPSTPRSQSFGSTKSLPSSPAKLPKISLDTFCNHYHISDDDKARLEKLGYVPGNRNIKTLDRSDWKDDAGFATLTWKTMLETHDHFLADVKDGLWDQWA